ncbi:MAG: tol-pal system protein YbgF [Thermodesulfobacteriota bacterium]
MNRLALVLLPVVAPFLVQCAAQQDIVTLDQRVRQNDTHLETLRRDLEDLRGQQAASRGKAERSELEAVQRRQAEMGDLLDQLKAELLRVGGRMDEVTHQKQRLSSDYQSAKTDLQTRLDGLATTVEGLGQRLARMEGEVEALKGARIDTAADLAVTAPPAKPAAPAFPGGPQPLEPASAKRKPGEPEPAATPAGPATDSTREQALYDAALGLFRNNQYAEARQAFGDYLAKYPQGKMVANARFWLGDSLYRLEEFEMAILEYQKVLNDFPTHEKAAAALLKQGLAFEQLKGPDNKETARILYKKLIADFPKSEQAEQAKKQLEKM